MEFRRRNTVLQDCHRKKAIQLWVDYALTGEQIGMRLGISKFHANTIIREYKKGLIDKNGCAKKIKKNSKP